MTARKAIETVTAEGWLERRRGSGTYVAQMPYAKTLGLSSFTADMRRRGLVPTTRVLDFRAGPAGPVSSERLEMSPGEHEVRFTRLRLADDEPVAVETTWMPAAVVPGITEHDLTGSLFETLAEKFEVSLGEASSTIGAATAEGPDGCSPGNRARRCPVCGSRWTTEIIGGGGSWPPLATTAGTGISSMWC